MKYEYLSITVTTEEASSLNSYFADDWEPMSAVQMMENLALIILRRKLPVTIEE